VRIRVEDCHIQRGENSGVASAPISLAILDALDCHSAEVDTNNITIDQSRVFPTPSSVATFIRDFDLGYFIEPFEFSL
jgi:hypothetical protein